MFKVYKAKINETYSVWYITLSFFPLFGILVIHLASVNGKHRGDKHVFCSCDVESCGHRYYAVLFREQPKAVCWLVNIFYGILLVTWSFLWWKRGNSLVHEVISRLDIWSTIFFTVFSTIFEDLCYHCTYFFKMTFQKLKSWSNVKIDGEGPIDEFSKNVSNVGLFYICLPQYLLLRLFLCEKQQQLGLNVVFWNTIMEKNIDLVVAFP